MNVDSLVHQIDNRLETIKNKIIDLALKIDPLEEEKENLERARRALLGEEKKKSYGRLSDMEGIILDYVENNPGLIASAIGRNTNLMNSPAESQKLYKSINELIAKKKLIKDKDRKIFISTKLNNIVEDFNQNV